MPLKLLRVGWWAMRKWIRNSSLRFMIWPVWWMHLPIFFCLWHLEYSQEYFILFFCTHPPYIKHKQRFHLHNNWVPGVSFPSHCFEIQNSSSSSSDFRLSQTSLIYSHYLATKEIGSKIKKGTGIGFVNERGKISIIRAQRIGFIPDHVKPSFFASSLMPLRTFTFRISPKSTNNDSIILFWSVGKYH